MRRLKALESFAKFRRESRWKGCMRSGKDHALHGKDHILHEKDHILSTMAIISFTECSAAFSSKVL